MVVLVLSSQQNLSGRQRDSPYLAQIWAASPSTKLSYQTGVATVENTRDISRKLKIELPYDIEIPLLGIHLESSMIQRDTCMSVFTAILFMTAKIRKQP